MKKTVIEVALFAIAILLVEYIKSAYDSNEKENLYIKKELPLFESYVFFDEKDVLHTDSECQGLKNASQHFDARWVKISELTSESVSKMCSRCVTNEQNEKLRNIYINK